MGLRLARTASLGAWIAALAWLGPPAAADPKAAPPSVNFNRDIRPLLSDTCFACHGPDQSRRKAGLGLDRREDALRELRSGNVAVVPGSRAKSELYQRIAAAEASDRMPPRSFGKKLTPAQVELIGRWIDQGAKWDTHWSYTPPRRPALPAV